jgi:hypothetical protein
LHCGRSTHRAVGLEIARSTQHGISGLTPEARVYADIRRGD